MTRQMLIEELAGALHMPLSESQKILEAMLNRIVRGLNAGERVEIRGFGSFHTRRRGARTGRNPKTGKQVSVQSKRVAYFRPSKELKELIAKLR